MKGLLSIYTAINDQCIASAEGVTMRGQSHRLTDLDNSDQTKMRLTVLGGDGQIDGG
jgi:hypothetical protein